jgi:hypothetical protein
MSWLIILLGGTFFFLAFIVFFSDSGRSRLAGNETRPESQEGENYISPDDYEHLIPTKCDTTIAQDPEFNRKHKAAYKAYMAGDIQGAVKIYDELDREFMYSAIVKLNFAQLLRKKAEHFYPSQMSPKEYKDLRKLIGGLLDDAKELIDHEQSRYPSNIKDYLKNLRDKLRG